MTDLLARRSVADAISGFFDSYIEHFERTDYRDGCVVATVALDEAGTHELLADAASTALHTWVDLLADALEAEGRTPEEAHGSGDAHHRDPRRHDRDVEGPALGRAVRIDTRAFVQILAPA